MTNKTMPQEPKDILLRYSHETGESDYASWRDVTPHQVVDYIDSLLSYAEDRDNEVRQMHAAFAKLERERDDLQKRPKLYECPDCAFTFDAVHATVDGKESCPCCEESRLLAEIQTLQKRLQQQGNERLACALEGTVKHIRECKVDGKLAYPNLRGDADYIEAAARALKTPEQHTQQSKLHGDLTAPGDATTRVRGDVEG